jgi:hypothetical protein
MKGPYNGEGGNITSEREKYFQKPISENNGKCEHVKLPTCGWG